MEIMEDKQTIRPLIESLIISDNMSAEEQFQNLTLRPIIKLQHELLIVYFKNYSEVKKFSFANNIEKEKIEFIQKAFQKDVGLKNELKGFVVGHFTVDEYLSYSKMSTEINKRLFVMIKERFQNSLKELAT